MPVLSDSSANKEQSSSSKSERSKEKMLLLPKRRKKSNIEKSLDVVFNKFVQSAADDFERLVVATVIVFCKLICTTYCVIPSCLNGLGSITSH